MSLLEKLGQKKAQKEQQKQAEKISEKKQSFDQINNQVLALNEKKERIASLRDALRENYGGAEKNLKDFKSQKTTLKKAYEENQEILEEEGIGNFEEMLEANVDEPEVKNYRNAGGRKPSKIDGAQLSSGEAGETGKLYQAVGTIAEIKNSLQAEMPEGLKLNFSAVTKKDEEFSNRELSFIQIDEYLKSLDGDIAELNKQKAAAYLETPEGVRQAISRMRSPEWFFRDKTFDNPDRFEVTDEVLELSKKTGLEPIKEVYFEALNKHLEDIAWGKKNKGQSQESEEQRAINNYPVLNQLNNLNYNYGDIAKLNENYQETLQHLISIIKNDKATFSQLRDYGLGRLSNEDLAKKPRENWDDSEILAHNYIKHAAELTHVGDPDDLKDSLREAIKNAESKNWQHSVISPEAKHNDFEKFNKFLEHLRDGVDENTKLVNDDDRGNDFISQLKKTPDAFKIEGAEKISRTIEIPRGIDSGYKSLDSSLFRQAMDQARKYWEPWQEEKKKIAEISRGAVDKRFAEAQESYFTHENKKTLEKIDSESKLSDGLLRSINYFDRHSNLQDPELAKRKIKIKADNWGSAKITEAGSEYKPIGEATNTARNKINEYADEQIETLNREINRLRSATLVWNLESKINKLDKKMWTFKEFKNDKPLKEADVIALGISQEEVIKMKGLREEKDLADKNYRTYDDNRLRFFRAIDEKKFNVRISEKDILNGQEMSFDELPERLQARLNEVNAYLDNLPEEEKVVIDERNRLNKQVEETEKKFKEAVYKNSDVMRKYQ